MIGFGHIHAASATAIVDWNTIAVRELFRDSDLPAAVAFSQQDPVEPGFYSPSEDDGAPDVWHPERLRVLIIEGMPLAQQLMQQVPDPTIRVVVCASPEVLVEHQVQIVDQEFEKGSADSYRNLVKLLHSYLSGIEPGRAPTAPPEPVPVPVPESVEQHPNRLRALVADFSRTVPDPHIREQAIDLWAQVLTQQTPEPLDLSTALEAGAPKELVSRMMKAAHDADARKLQRAYALLCAGAPAAKCAVWAKADTEELVFLNTLLPARWGRVFYDLDPDIEPAQRKVRAALAQMREKERTQKGPTT